MEIIFIYKLASAFSGIAVLILAISTGLSISRIEKRMKYLETHAHVRQPNKYTLLWDLGMAEIIEGYTFYDAMEKNGYLYHRIRDFLYRWEKGDIRSSVKWNGFTWISSNH